MHDSQKKREKKELALLDNFQPRHLEVLRTRKRLRLSEGEVRGEEFTANTVSLDVDVLRDQLEPAHN